MSEYISINKKFFTSADAKISVNERSNLFGDGIFETCKIFDGIICNYQAHENRIIRGLEALKIPAKITDLKKDCQNLIAKNKIKNGILKIMISRGIGSTGYLPTYQSQPLIIIETLPERKISNNKIRIGISKIKVPQLTTTLQKCKTMQSLNYILAKISAHENGNFDDVLLNKDGFISECSSANIFWIKNNKIYTSSNKCGAIFGTVREKLLKKFPAKINLVKARPDRLKSADEIFLTNAVFLVIAVDEFVLNGKIFKKQKQRTHEVRKWLEDNIKKQIEN